MAEPVIRPARREDADTIGALWTDLVAMHHAMDPRLPLAAREGDNRYAARVRAQLDDGYTHVLVAEVDGAVVGYVMGLVVDLVPDIFQQEITGFLADIYVVPAQRRQGVGRQLVEGLAGWFRSRGVQHMEWQVAAVNADGIAFWQSLGGKALMIRMRTAL